MKYQKVFSLGVTCAMGALLVAGCARASTNSAGSSADTAGSSAATAPTVAGQPAGTYVATAVVGHTLVAGSSLSVTFDAGRLNIHAGCNAMSGTAVLDSGTLQVGDLAETTMACDQALMDQDSWVAAFLGSTPRWSLTGGTLTLTGIGIVAESITLVQAPATTAHALEDTRWQLRTITTGETAPSVPTGVDPAITVSAGRIAFDAQCNSVGGDVSVTPDTLTISQVIGTLMACEDARGTMEKLLTTVIAGTVPYVIDGDQLTITGADGTKLTFVPSDPVALPSGTATSPDRTIQGATEPAVIVPDGY